MKAGIIIGLLSFALTHQLAAQEKCAATAYQQEALRQDPSLRNRIDAIETFTRQQQSRTTSRTEATIIKIPVVVHILYHTPGEKISDAQVASQIESLNRYFRRRNSDTM